MSKLAIICSDEFDWHSVKTIHDNIKASLEALDLNNIEQEFFFVMK